MNKLVLGGVLMLVLVGIGLFWWQGRAEVEQAAPPPDPEALASETPSSDVLPLADPGAQKGPAPPEASELTREQQRFFRYDRNRDWRITRSEMLSTRSDGFRSLDKDGNNLLTFEEWAVTTVEKFEGADANDDRELSPKEFETTKPKPVKKRTCAC